MKMRLRKLGLAIAVVGALGAILASSALGAATTETASWYAGTTTKVVTADKPLQLKTASHEHDNGVTSTAATFKVTPGATTYYLQATGVECVGCNITNGTTTGEMAMAKGKIKFTGVTVVEPKPCEVGEGATKGTVETTEIIAHGDYMHPVPEGKAYVKFEPAKGPTTAFANVKITGCEALNTTLVVKGLVFGEAKNKTGVAAVEQGITFNKAIHETTLSGLTAGEKLNVNEKTAILDAGAIGELTSKEPFGINTP